MGQPSSEQLHAALSRSFVVAPPGAGRRAGAPPAMSLDEAITILETDLEFPGDQRKGTPLPRVVHSLALWNLAVSMLNPLEVPAADKPARARLDKLVISIFRRPLDEIDVLRKQGIDPLLTFARAHKIDRYEWDPPKLVDGKAASKLMILVQTPIQQIRIALDPEKWGDRCALFWSQIQTVNRPDRQLPGHTCTATLNLPGPAAAQATKVRIEITTTETPLWFKHKYQVLAAGVAQNPPVLCEGTMTAEKDEGNPWATRITHEKAMPSEPPTLSASVEDTLRFWIQAETVCLAVPQ